ncbi:branched-chain amino acid ABC transporter permease [Caloramator australicus]|uniref:Branched-chain amino acid transport system permease protein LivM (TC 3.A.1.4.1) n=1 Tax=Caloramator australicus RC3 TaxID=857293 RepID=I7K9G4_9CLOT|nr:branched-chain amino acid ABC transporter permease [Caloramator australicus]CCJ34265.1 Branched-chain amino acid transport system permease protein LivM (TC 3.A.1.4.1) [Caloramator australicus RC3]
MLSWYYLKGIIMLAGIYLLPVLGLSLLTGFTGLFSFGHAGFMAIGGYTTAFMMMKLEVPFIPAILMGGLFAAFFSFIIGKLTLKLKGDYFCIATLGFGEAIRLLLDNIQYFGGARGWPGLPLKTTLITVIIIDIIAVILLRNIIRSRHGRNMIAVREEELASSIIGIDTFKYKMISLVISAFYAGVGGGLLGTYLGFLQPKIFSLTRSTELTIIVIFGGLGSLTGSVVGTILLIALPEILRSFANWRLVVYGVIVVFIMIARPEGLMGGKELSFDVLRNLFRKRVKEAKAEGGK